MLFRSLCILMKSCVVWVCVKRVVCVCGAYVGFGLALEASPALRLATFRSGDDFGDRFSSTGRRFSWRSLRSFGWLGTIRSSEGTHGWGKAPRDEPTMENAKTGRSPNLGPLESRRPKFGERPVLPFSLAGAFPGASPWP